MDYMDLAVLKGPYTHSQGHKAAVHWKFFAFMLDMFFCYMKSCRCFQYICLFLYPWLKCTWPWNSHYMFGMCKHSALITLCSCWLVGDLWPSQVTPSPEWNMLLGYFQKKKHVYLSLIIKFSRYYVYISIVMKILKVFFRICINLEKIWCMWGITSKRWAGSDISGCRLMWKLDKRCKYMAVLEPKLCVSEYSAVPLLKFSQ